MKAKEAANFYLNKKLTKSLTDTRLLNREEKLLFIHKSFMNDMRKLMRVRNVKTDENVYTVIMEVNGKWRAFARRVNAKEKNTINTGGFLKNLKDQNVNIQRLLAKKGM